MNVGIRGVHAGEDEKLGTTKWHLSQIFGKLHARNRAEAIAKVRQIKLL